MAQIKPTPEPASRAAPQLLPPEDLMKIVGSPSAQNYLSSGRHFLGIFRRNGGLKPEHRVLDVGCGCGRMALPLTSYLGAGSYEGFDVVPELIAWCAENITPRHPNFRFVQVDVANAFYYGRGAQSAGAFRFPYEDATFDFTFLTSVYTHMLMDDFTRYTAEVVRTLKPGGTALMTFFLLNPESLRLKETPRSLFGFRHRHSSDGICIEDPKRPEAAVAYPEETARSVLRAGGLEVQQILLGSWCGREGTVSGQDIVVARRPNAAADPPAPAGPQRSIGHRLKRWLAP
jgi:SAM-dependent methyltransferase